MPAARPLYLYKYHAEDCIVHSLEKLTPKAKKFYANCDCYWWITGINAAGEYIPRQTTGHRDKPSAEAYLASHNLQVAEEIGKVDEGITLADAVQKFLSRHGLKTRPKVKAQHELLLGRLVTFAKGQAVTHASGLTYDLCMDFLTYGLPDSIADTTRETYKAKLKVFLKEANKSKWIADEIAKDIENVPAQHEETEPYSEKETACILAHAEKLNGGTTGYATCGASFRLLIEFMLETGLRVSDTVRFNPSACVKSKTGLWKYIYKPKKQRKTKTPKTAVTFLTERLKLAIDGMKWFSEKLPFAYAAITADDDKHERAVYERMVEIGKRCNIDECRPHRCRDTFAVNKLKKGMSLDDVSKLLAHGSVRVTEKHYAKWTVGREDRLEALFAQTV
jgi:integrase